MSTPFANFGDGLVTMTTVTNSTAIPVAITNGSGTPTASAISGDYYFDTVGRNLYLSVGGTNWSVVSPVLGSTFVDGVAVKFYVWTGAAYHYWTLT